MSYILDTQNDDDFELLLVEQGRVCGRSRRQPSKTPLSTSRTKCAPKIGASETDRRDP